MKKSAIIIGKVLVYVWVVAAGVSILIAPFYFLGNLLF